MGRLRSWDFSMKQRTQRRKWRWRPTARRSPRVQHQRMAAAQKTGTGPSVNRIRRDEKRNEETKDSMKQANGGTIDIMNQANGEANECMNQANEEVNDIMNQANGEANDSMNQAIGEVKDSKKMANEEVTDD